MNSFYFLRNYHDNDLKIVIEAKMRFVVVLRKFYSFLLHLETF